MADAGSILVVEDDAGIRAMLAEYLGAHGYAVAEAGDGATMRAALARAVPDVVLLDVHLPGEDGLTLARFLRERHDVGIIMVTGAARRRRPRRRASRSAPTTTSTKPFDLRELRARVKSVMRRVRERPAGAGGAPKAARRRRAPARVPVGALLARPRRRARCYDARRRGGAAHRDGVRPAARVRRAAATRCSRATSS